MRVYIANTVAGRLHAEHPDQIGLMLGPNFIRQPKGIPYGLDNGRYGATVPIPCDYIPDAYKYDQWSARTYARLLNYVSRQDQRPEWLVVPDVPYDAEGTYREWALWAPLLEPLGPLAVAVQNGMTPASVKKHIGKDPVIFVGGDTQWKHLTIPQWTASFSRVHVGRVNSPWFLEKCEHFGVESVDGNGWGMGGKKQMDKLVTFLSGVRISSFSSE